MARRVVSVLALVTISSVGAGCGTSKAPNAATAQQLATQITASGVGCRDFAVTDTANAAGATNASSGACTVSGQHLALAVYQSADERNKGQVELLKGCIGRRSLNSGSTSTWAFTKGPTWIVLGTDHKAVATVGRALHTSVQTAPC